MSQLSPMPTILKDCFRLWLNRKLKNHVTVSCLLWVCTVARWDGTHTWEYLPVYMYWPLDNVSCLSRPVSVTWAPVTCPRRWSLDGKRCGGRSQGGSLKRRRKMGRERSFMSCQCFRTPPVDYTWVTFVCTPSAIHWHTFTTWEGGRWAWCDYVM